MGESIEKQPFLEFVNAIGKLVLFFDRSGKILYANDLAREELGMTEQEEADMEEVIPFYQEQKLVFYPFAGEHEAEHFSMTLYRRNHTCFPATVYFGVWEQYGCGYCVAGNESVREEMKIDMDRAKVENKELRDMRNDFVANVTHELRTPLNGFKGHLEQLQLMEEKTEVQDNIFQIMSRCCVTMEKIINNILDFNKLQSGKFQLEETEFSLADCLQQVRETNESRANERGLNFTVQMEEGVPDRIIGDSLHLQQVLNNLVSNALKFTETGFVKVKVVKVYQLGKKVELFFVVVDSGIGISVEEKEKIFDSFVQADASITRKYGGTGLGLSITKDLLKMMGGSINLESEKGRGSTFSFSLTFQTVSEDGMPEETAASCLDKQGIFDEIERERLEAAMIYRIGSEENREQLRSNMEKLIICIEMHNWVKAEQFATMVKKLLDQGNARWKKMAFRLEMAVRREDYDKCAALYEELRDSISDLIENED